jgi:site-specific DNA-methyltransferase (adenine-specific)
MTGAALVVQGDALHLPLPDGSVDAICTDPPYGLGFMGHQWDQPGKYAATSSAHGYGKFAFNGEKHPAMEAGRYDVSQAGNARFQAWCQAWATEALRVLKPGGWLLAFGGTRTWHRLACGIEDAGFEHRDTIAEFGPLAWLYGQGFPKGKACLKPGWEPILLARKPGSNVLQIDASRVEGRPRTTHADGNFRTTTADGWRHAPGPQPPVAAGRWPANVVLVHSEGCQPVGVRKVPTGTAVRHRGVRESNLYGQGMGQLAPGSPDLGYADPDGTETVEAWECDPDCPVFLLDQQSGERPSGSRAAGVRKGMGYHGANGDGGPAIVGNAGGASRFYFTAKAGRNERVTIDGDQHPTVKPLDLMRWLVRLVTPPGGLILDMFGGSGTTGEAAMLEGFTALVLDKDPASCAKAKIRAHPLVRRRVVTTRPLAVPEQGSLL